MRFLFFRVLKSVVYKKRRPCVFCAVPLRSYYQPERASRKRATPIIIFTAVQRHSRTFSRDDDTPSLFPKANCSGELSPIPTPPSIFLLFLVLSCPVSILVFRTISRVSRSCGSRSTPPSRCVCTVTSPRRRGPTLSRGRGQTAGQRKNERGSASRFGGIRAARRGGLSLSITLRSCRGRPLSSSMPKTSQSRDGS